MTTTQLATTSLLSEIRATVLDACDVLCIDLLAAEGYWLNRPDFVDHCVHRHGDSHRFDPAAAINFTHLDRTASPGQRAFLRLASSFTLTYAVALWDTIPYLDPHQLALILNGIARHAGLASPITVDGSLAARFPLATGGGQ